MNLEPLLDALADKVAERVLQRLKSAQPTKRLLVVSEAAEYLGRTPAAVRNMAQTGKLPVVRDGARIFFDRSDLDPWVEKRKQAAL